MRLIVDAYRFIYLGPMQQNFMKNLSKYLLFFALILSSLSAFSQEANRTIDDRINDFMEPITSALMSVIFFSVQIGDMSIPFVLV